MTDVVARPGRDVDVGDFGDLVPGVRVSSVAWVDRNVRVSFDGDLTADQVSRVRRRIASATTAEETLREQAEVFLATDPRDLTLLDVARATQRLARLVLSDRGGPVS